VNTGEKEMKWFVEAIGIFQGATGKPSDYCCAHGCGIPHEVGSTGFGVVQATKVAAELINLDIKGATVSIHGFGNVGTFAYKFLTELGAKVVAISDKNNVLYSKAGFENDSLQEIIDNKQCLDNYKGKAERLSHEEFWKIPVDIMIPASVTDVINDSNKNDIQTKIIVEGANIPMKEEIEEDKIEKRRTEIEEGKRAAEENKRILAKEKVLKGLGKISPGEEKERNKFLDRIKDKQKAAVAQGSIQAKKIFT